jgi:hypothetical protein
MDSDSGEGGGAIGAEGVRPCGECGESAVAEVRRVVGVGEGRDVGERDGVGGEFGGCAAAGGDVGEGDDGCVEGGVRGVSLLRMPENYYIKSIVNGTITAWAPIYLGQVTVETWRKVFRGGGCE